MRFRPEREDGSLATFRRRCPRTSDRPREPRSEDQGVRSAQRRSRATVSAVAGLRAFEEAKSLALENFRSVANIRKPVPLELYRFLRPDHGAAKQLLKIPLVRLSRRHHRPFIAVANQSEGHNRGSGNRRQPQADARVFRIDRQEQQRCRRRDHGEGRVASRRRIGDAELEASVDQQRLLHEAEQQETDQDQGSLLFVAREAGEVDEHIAIDAEQSETDDEIERQPGRVGKEADDRVPGANDEKRKRIKRMSQRNRQAPARVEPRT